MPKALAEYIKSVAADTAEDPEAEQPLQTPVKKTKRGSDSGSPEALPGKKTKRGSDPGSPEEAPPGRECLFFIVPIGSVESSGIRAS